MSKDDFEKRLERISKVPSAGTERVVHEAMLRQEVSEVQKRHDEDRIREDDDPNGWVSWLWVFLFLSFLVLAGLFVNDPAEAARVSVVIVPLMLFIIAAIFIYDARRHGPSSIFWDILINGEFITMLLRMLRMLR